MKPFRVDIRVRNNRLVRLREELGLSQAEMARRIPITVGCLCAYENLHTMPWSGDHWKAAALAIAAFHGVSPEYIWPECVAQVVGAQRSFELDLREAKTLATDPHRQLEAKEIGTLLHEMTAKLSPKHARVLEQRFDDERTLKDVGDDYEVSRERIRTIEREAVRAVGDELWKSAKRQERDAGINAVGDDVYRGSYPRW